MAKKKEKTLEEKLQEALVPENQWPYMLPENWCWTRLNQVVNILNGDRGKNYPSKKDYVKEGIPFINAGAIADGVLEPEYFNYIGESKFESLRAGKIQIDDILYCLRGSLGKCAIIHLDMKGAISSSLCIMRRKYHMNNKYIFYFLNSDIVEKQQSLVENGSAQPNLSAANVGNYIIPLPPLSEQKRIVHRIESLFAKLDEAKEKIQQVLDGAEMRKAAILHKAFTGELTKNWRKENGISDDSWNIVLVDDIAQVKGGKRIPKGKNLVIDNTGHPYIKAGNLKNGTVLDSNIMYVPLDVWESIKKYTVNTGDVYITNVGACIGDCGIIPSKFNGANLTENAVKLTDLKCDSLFLSRYMASNLVQRQIKNMIASATLGKLAISKIKTLKVNLPLREEQIQINFILDRQLVIQDNITKLGRHTIEDIDTMKKSILAKAFRGELGTNNPTEDSALNLLKEVLQDKS